MKPEILHEDKTDESKKKRLKYFFVIQPLHGENAIWKVFLQLFFQVLLKRFK